VFSGLTHRRIRKAIVPLASPPYAWAQHPIAWDEKGRYLAVGTSKGEVKVLTAYGATVLDLQL